MTMRKKDVLKFLPQAKTLRKEAITKARQGDKLTKEAAKAREIADALVGVQLHENFPLRIAKYNGGSEVVPGCDDVRRTAFVKPSGNGNTYIVTTYKNDGNEVDGTPVQGEHAKATALRLAKDFVVSGKKVKAVETNKATKTGAKRGRPASN